MTTRLTAREKAYAEDVEATMRQRITVRCRCGWSMKDILMSDRERVFQAHLVGARHTRRNQKSGPQPKTRDRLAGMSWAK